MYTSHHRNYGLWSSSGYQVWPEYKTTLIIRWPFALFSPNTCFPRGTISPRRREFSFLKPFSLIKVKQFFVYLCSLSVSHIFTLAYQAVEVVRVIFSGCWHLSDRLFELLIVTFSATGTLILRCMTDDLVSGPFLLQRCQKMLSRGQLWMLRSSFMSLFSIFCWLF